VITILSVNPLQYLKARIVEEEERSVARQQLGKHFLSATNTHKGL
jgi:hypothetical protein